MMNPELSGNVQPTPMVITDAGLRVLSQGQLGQPISITRVSVGDGYVQPETAIKDMTGLVNEIRNVPINGKKIIGDGTVQIDTIVSNKDIEEAYFLREVGIWAVDNETGAEILYSYANYGDAPIFIAADMGYHSINFVNQIFIVIGRAETVSVVVNEGYGYAMQEDMEEALAKKVDKVAGRDLSDNNFSDDLKEKLENLEPSHFRGLFPSLAALVEAIPIGNPGDYAHVDAGTSENTVLYNWNVDDQEWKIGTATTETPASIKEKLLQNPDTNNFSNADKEKLQEVESGAQENQNAFSKVTVGSEAILADEEQTTFTIAAGTNVALSINKLTKTITISAIDTVYTLPAAAENTLGGVKRATVAEAAAMTDNTKYLTPAGVKVAIAATPEKALPDAAVGVKGIVELATPEEAQAGTDENKAVTPTGLKAAVGGAWRTTSLPFGSTTSGGIFDVVSGKEINNTQIMLAHCWNANTDKSTVLLSMDAGKSFVPVWSVYINSSSAPNLHMAITGDWLFIALSEGGVGTLHRSNDWGKTWSSSQIGTAMNILSLDAFQNLTNTYVYVLHRGTATQSAGAVKISLNAGQTWASYPVAGLSAMPNCQGSFLCNMNYCTFLIGGNNAQLLNVTGSGALSLVSLASSASQSGSDPVLCGCYNTKYVFYREDGVGVRVRKISNTNVVAAAATLPGTGDLYPVGAACGLSLLNSGATCAVLLKAAYPDRSSYITTTIDGGVSWSPVKKLETDDTAMISRTAHSSRRLNELFFFVVSYLSGKTVILTTFDSGKTFSKEQIPLQGSMRLCFGNVSAASDKSDCDVVCFSAIDSAVSMTRDYASSETVQS